MNIDTQSAAAEERGYDPENLSEEEAGNILAAIYKNALNGIPKVSRSVDELVEDYMSRASSPAAAAEELARWQVMKCGTSGFLTGLGGMITLPVTIPANVGSVLYVQMRMIAAIAQMGGYDVRSDQVQTLVYMCLVGTSLADIAKQAGIKIGEKGLQAAIKKVPGAVLVKINQKVGFRLLTKFGGKGVVNLVKLVPIAGGVVGGGMDVVATKAIAKNAVKLFIKGEDPCTFVPAEVVVEATDVVDAENFDTSTQEGEEPGIRIGSAGPNPNLGINHMANRNPLNKLRQLF